MVLIVVVRLGSVAYAQSEHASVTAGVSIDTSQLLDAALTLDASYRLRWLAVRAIFSRGIATTLADQDGGSGSFRRFVAGVEARLCRAVATDLASGSHACAYIGIDAGYEHEHAAYRVPPSYDSHGALVTARLGEYATYHHLVVRGGLVFVMHDEHSAGGTGWTPGLGIELSVGYRW